MPSVNPARYNIPCRILPGGNGLRNGIIPPAPPPAVKGTILISANEAAGQAWGPGELNPYRQFFDRKPDDIIANSILVFHGSFDASLAAAAVHSAESRRLLAQNLNDEALREAQFATQLAPDSAEMQAVLCQAMLKSHLSGSDQVCRNALAIARRVHPDYQLKRMPSVLAISRMYAR